MSRENLLPRTEKNLDASHAELTHSTANFLLVDELGKLVNIGIRGVRDGAILHSLAAPMAPLIPLPEAGRMDWGVRFLGRHHKNVDDVLAARVHERGNILTTKN